MKFTAPSLDKIFTLDFFPSSSILYSVIVFMFPLMVSFGDGSVPEKWMKGQIKQFPINNQVMGYFP